MAKHKPCTGWHTHLDARKHGVYGIVRTESEDTILVGISNGDIVNSLRVPRKVARLLARRINQCLDDTK